MHITKIKIFFKQKNIKKSYKKEILDYNIKKFSLMIKIELDMFFSVKILTQANKNVKLQINLVRNAKKIIKNLKYYFKKIEY